MNYFDKKIEGKDAKILNINSNKTYFSFVIDKSKMYGKLKHYNKNK